MNFDPQKFFIGLMDFFSILLPGASLTYLTMDVTGPFLLTSARYAHLQGSEGTAVFLFGSYLLGHLIFLLGAWLDELYDAIRTRVRPAQIQQLARDGCALNLPTRFLVWLFFKRESNAAVTQAARLRRAYLAPIGASEAMNTFQWSKALLNVESPDSLATVHRFEADSKFFRCFVIVLIALAVFWFRQGQVALGITALVLLPFAAWRYADQRLKATNQAYWSVITVVARDGKLLAPAAKPTESTLTHAGGVVYRQRFRWTKYLLVQAKNNRNQWVLPKGHVEAGETPNVTAIREVQEETGVWARIDGDLGVVAWTHDGITERVQFYLMRRVAWGRRAEPERQSRWRSLENALRDASFDDTKELLRRAEDVRARMSVTQQR